MKILTVVGARPQFVKAAIVSKELKKSNKINEIIVHTGQHFDKNMSDIFFKEMEIPAPNYHLNINGLSHGAMTGQMLEGIEKIIQQEKPDYVMVYGDTNSTIAGALAAKKLHVKVIHVEAGLRSFNTQMPEEINRILTDRISDVLFCPTQTAIANLKQEGISHTPDNQVILNGDVMQDAALYYASFAHEKSKILQNLGLTSGHFILCTIHRQENTDSPNRLTQIIQTLNEINKKISVICPIHPRTKKLIKENNLTCHFKTIEPVGYFDMLELIQNSKMILTDSGGLQKESYFFNKFCVTLREETEWVELVENGYNKLVGCDSSKIQQAVTYFWDKEFDKKSDLYGGGKASEIIRLTIENYGE